MMPGSRALTLVVLGLSGLTSGCADLFSSACTGELRFTLSVEVRDGSEMPAARGVTGTSAHESGLVTELAPGGDSLRLTGDWQRELPGNHRVELRRPGFLDARTWVDVGEDGCHVEPLTVRMQITPDPAAIEQTPVFFSEGPPIAADPASAGVQVLGDTLAITGFAPTGCTELRATAFRLGSRLHVQIEPSDIPTTPCYTPRAFEVRYILPPDHTHLLVTNGFSFPVELFSGSVRPS